MVAPGPLWQAVDDPAWQSELSVGILDDLRAGDGRPWTSNEMGPAGVGEVPDHEAWEVFRERWNFQVPLGSLPPADRPRTGIFGGFRPREDFEEDPEETAMFLEQVSPWGVQFPGLALAERDEVAQEAIAEALQAMEPSRIGLVAVERPADIPFRIGWWGATNHFIETSLGQAYGANRNRLDWKRPGWIVCRRARKRPS